MLSEDSGPEEGKQDDAGRCREQGLDIGDASVLSWLLHHAPELQWTPVLGSHRLSKVYMGIVLVCLADMVYNLVDHFGEWERFRRSLKSAPALRYAAFAAPYTGLAATAKIILGRHILTSEAIEELFADLGSHMEVVDVSACLTQARQALQWGSLLGVFSPLLAGSAIVGGLLVHTNLLTICCHVLVPCLLCVSIGQGANYVVAFASDLGIARVDIMCKDLERVSSQAQCQRDEKFFTRLMAEYWKLDKQLMKICRLSVSVVAVVVSTSLAAAYCAAMTYMTVDQRFWKVVSLACLAACMYSCLATIWPLAKLSDRCTSQRALYSKPSLLVQLMLCGEMEMTSLESAQYLRLVEIVKTCPLGALLPLVGRITTSDIMTYVKLLCTLFPTLLAYTLSE